jgi:hypothetical protein
MGLTVHELPLSSLTHFGVLNGVDCLFINCADEFRFLQVRNSLAPLVRSFVVNGGVLYASDFAAPLLEDAFPDAIRFHRAKESDPESLVSGSQETITAEVVDASLRDYLLSAQVQIHFDMSGWYPVQWLTPMGRVYLQDTFLRIRGFGIPDSGAHTAGEVVVPLEQQKVVVPIVVSFLYGRGFVVYTAFHNKAQPTEIERRLIEFLAIRPLTMRLSQQVAEEINRPVEVGALGERKEGRVAFGQKDGHAAGDRGNTVKRSKFTRLSVRFGAPVACENCRRLGRRRWRFCGDALAGNSTATALATKSECAAFDFDRERAVAARKLLPSTDRHKSPAA